MEHCYLDDHVCNVWLSKLNSLVANYFNLYTGNCIVPDTGTSGFAIESSSDPKGK